MRTSGATWLAVLGAAIALTSCSGSDAYSHYMAEGCKGLAQMSSAYSASDEASMRKGYNSTGGFNPAAEEASGNASKMADVGTVILAVKVLFIAAWEPPENNDGLFVWRHASLSEADRTKVSQALGVCKQF